MPVVRCPLPNPPPSPPSFSAQLVPVGAAPAPPSPPRCQCGTLTPSGPPQSARTSDRGGAVLGAPSSSRGEEGVTPRVLGGEPPSQIPPQIPPWAEELSPVPLNLRVRGYRALERGVPQKMGGTHSVVPPPPHPGRFWGAVFWGGGCFNLGSSPFKNQTLRENTHGRVPQICPHPLNEPPQPSAGNPRY